MSEREAREWARPAAQGGQQQVLRSRSRADESHQNGVFGQANAGSDSVERLEPPSVRQTTAVRGWGISLQASRVPTEAQHRIRPIRHPHQRVSAAREQCDRPVANFGCRSSLTHRRATHHFFLPVRAWRILRPFLHSLQRGPNIDIHITIRFTTVVICS